MSGFAFQELWLEFKVKSKTKPGIILFIAHFSFQFTIITFPISNKILSNYVFELTFFKT